MQLENMSTAELIALVKRQEQELAAAKAEGAVSKVFSDLMTFGTGAIQVTHIPYEDMLLQPVQQPTPECGACHGSGWVSRDADIGTEQECPSCGGSGDGEVAPVAAPVAGQEPVGIFTRDMRSMFRQIHPDAVKLHSGVPPGCFPLFAAPVPAASVQPATVTLDGHQLRMALDFINPDGLDDRDQMDNDLTFGVRQHQGDDGTISTGMCCWNDDSDGVLPLDGEYPDLAKDNCPTCGNSWAEHDFAVPAPYCPEPRKATTKQPDSAPVVDMEDITYLTAHIKRAKEIVGCPEDDNLIEFLSLAQRAANVAQPVAADEEAEFKAWAGVAHRNAASYSVRDYQLGLSAWNARAALAAPVAAPVDVPAASVHPESAPEYKEITDHNGRITGYVLSNADKMPSYSQPVSGRDAALVEIASQLETGAAGSQLDMRRLLVDSARRLSVLAAHPANVAPVGELSREAISAAYDVWRDGKDLPLSDAFAFAGGYTAAVRATT